MRTIIFLILPYSSHYMASFEFAKEWRNNGYRVIFTGELKLKELIEDEGFEFYEFQYLISYKIRTFKSFLGVFLKTLVDKSFIRNRYREFYSVQLSVGKLIQKYQPEHIFIDEYIAEYYFFLKRIYTQVTIINTRFSTKKVNNIPPLNSNYIPSSKWYSVVICEMLWIEHFIKLRLRSFIEKMAFIGLNEDFFWKRLCIQNNFTWKNEIAFDHCLNRSIKGIKTIILAPQSLEFKHRVLQENEVFFHKRIFRNEIKYISEEYKSLVQKVTSFKKHPQHKVVYVAFGTLSGKEMYKVYQFFIRLIKALEDERNILLVISKGGLELDLPKVQNLETIQFMPQIDFLQYTDLMINHGGIGSIKECYDRDIPIIAIPVNKKIDQMGCAARIESNNLGLMGDLVKESEKSIYHKVNSILQNFVLKY